MIAKTMLAVVAVHMACFIVIVTYMTTHRFQTKRKRKNNNKQQQHDHKF